jgi:hypothetical protein
MSFFDAILNLAGLLLWLRWRDVEESPRQGISLVTTLKKAEPRFPRIWYLAALLMLLLVRPLLYWQLGSELRWTPKIWFGIIALSFRSDFFWRAFAFSFFSFGAALGIFYLCLILLSILLGKNSADPMQSLINTQLGKISLLPRVIKIFLPWIISIILWCALNKPLVAMGILSPAKSISQVLSQGAVAGLGIYLTWKYLIAGLLLLHLLNSYIYFGAWPFWNFIDNAASGFLKLLSWIPLRVGKIDFAPFAGIAIVFVAGEFAARALIWIYQRLPF